MGPFVPIKTVVSFGPAKLNSDNLIATDPPEAAADTVFLEFDDAVLKRDQLALNTAPIAQYERVRVDRCDKKERDRDH